MGQDLREKDGADRTDENRMLLGRTEEKRMEQDRTGENRMETEQD